VRLKRRQPRAGARGDLRGVRVGDDRADRPVHIGDQPQPRLANQRAQQV